MSYYNQSKNNSRLVEYSILFFYISATLIINLEALATSHQLSPWYMQLGDKEKTSTGLASSSQQTQSDYQFDFHPGKNCIEPNRQLYQQFVNTYNRSHPDDYDELQRKLLFEDTFKRAIIFNEIIEGESNKAPTASSNSFNYIRSNDLWYSDINDCELAHIKYTITGIFDLVDKSEFDLALHNLRLANKDFPLLNGESMKQACYILLVRLHDRAKEDWIKKWFEWPKYFKKLAAYDYNQKQLQQLSQFGLASQLELYSFVHPRFYKDIRFNEATLNKVVENEKILRDFKSVNVGKNSEISDQEKNERIGLFRRRWTMARLINDKLKGANQFSVLLTSINNNQNQEDIARASRISSDSENSRSAASLAFLTIFSDLSDDEFVAYINDDPSYVKNNSRSVEYIKQFPIFLLNRGTKLDLVNEILLRRKPNNNWIEEDKLYFADQLISDLGLPIGSRVYNENNEAANNAFNEVGRKFNKNYFINNDPYRLRQAPEEETEKRRDIFTKNYAKIRAWQLKEDWRLNNEQSLYMLRLADMSWDEIKFTLFKLCCLGPDQIRILSDNNSTIRYLASTNICQQDSSGSIEKQDEQVVRALELFYHYLVFTNKHHQNLEVYKERFSRFRENLADIAKHSCEKNLYLFRLLESKKFHMSMVDDKVLDDINLDRFLYYDIQLDVSAKTEESDSWLSNIFGGGNSNSRARNRDNYSGKEGPTYLQSERFFEAVRVTKTNWYNQSRNFVSDRSTDGRYGTIIRKNTIKNKDGQDVAIDTSNIYNFVKNRYQLCLDMKIIEDSGKAQCRPYTSGDESDRLIEATNYNSQNIDKCAQYRNGLDLYPNGLHSIKVPIQSASAISRASCRRKGSNPDNWNGQYTLARLN